MIAYPDTSFLVSLYVRQIHSPRAAAHFAAMQEPLHVTDLVLYEFRLAVRLAVYRAEHGAPDVVTREDAASAFANLETDLADGSLVLVACDWPSVLATSERLAAAHGMDSGYRAFDILHVATAQQFTASEFLTFDGKQRELAKSEGLLVPL
jgi:predicted nucleic acid-binding protein